MLVFRFSPSFCATSRVITSELPPGGNGTTMVMGRDGKSDCATAGAVAEMIEKMKAQAAQAIDALIVPSLSWASRPIGREPRFDSIEAERQRTRTSGARPIGVAKARRPQRDNNQADCAENQAGERPPAWRPVVRPV